MTNVYLLKDVAKLSGQSVYTLKYYLKLGLIKEIGRSPDTNFRFFDDSTVDALVKIREMKLKNISLKGIKNLLTHSTRSISSGSNPELLSKDSTAESGI